MKTETEIGRLVNTRIPAAQFDKLTDIDKWRVVQRSFELLDAYQEERKTLKEEIEELRENRKLVMAVDKKWEDKAMIAFAQYIRSEEWPEDNLIDALANWEKNNNCEESGPFPTKGILDQILKDSGIDKLLIGEGYIFTVMNPFIEGEAEKIKEAKENLDYGDMEKVFDTPNPKQKHTKKDMISFAMDAIKSSMSFTKIRKKDVKRFYKNWKENK